MLVPGSGRPGWGVSRKEKPDKGSGQEVMGHRRVDKSTGCDIGEGVKGCAGPEAEA